MMSASTAADEFWRFLEKAMPTWEKRRSTAADEATGQPRYWRAMTARFGNSLATPWGVGRVYAYCRVLLLDCCFNVTVPILNVKKLLFNILNVVSVLVLNTNNIVFF